jgi:hypothetical protein
VGKLPSAWGNSSVKSLSPGIFFRSSATFQTCLANSGWFVSSYCKWHSWYIEYPSCWFTKRVVNLCPCYFQPC